MPMTLLDHNGDRWVDRDSFDALHQATLDEVRRRVEAFEGYWNRDNVLAIIDAMKEEPTDD